MSEGTVVTGGTVSRVFVAQVSLLYDQASIIFIGTTATALTTLAAMWSLIPHGVLLAWTTAVLVLTACRAILARARRRSESASLHAGAWARAFVAGAFVSGVLWGLLGVILFDPVGMLPIAFSVAILAGMTSGSVASLSAWYPAYVAFAVPAIVPFAVVNFRHGGPVYLAFSGLSLALLAVNLAYGRLIQRTIVESIRLRFENLDLVEGLLREKENAEAANRAKTAFLAAASHDLRQPAHALGLFIGTLERIAQSDRSPRLDPVREVVDEMSPTLGALQALLTGLLDISRLDAGMVVVNRRPFPLQTCFDQIAQELGETARRKGLDFRIRPTKARVDTDPLLLRRVVANLVSNAVKYTSRGRVLVGCRRRGKELELQVWDTGVGIADADQARIFEEFLRLDASPGEGEQGLGLGLAIVQRTAALLQHPLRVISRPGKGSLFALRMPLAPGSSLPALRIDPSRELPPNGGTIVVVDDEEMVRTSIAGFLRQHGYAVEAAATPDEILERLDTIHDPAHLIVDYRLARGATGGTAIRRIRDALGSNIQATIITGDTSPERIREAAALGHRLLHKPIDPATLLEVLRANRPTSS